MEAVQALEGFSISHCALKNSYADLTDVNWIVEFIWEIFKDIITFKFTKNFMLVENIHNIGKFIKWM